MTGIKDTYMGNPPVHRARKRFGQHFLHDTRVINRIVQAVNPRPGEPLVEIGPGQGALTFPLLQKNNQLTVIELDRDLVPLLQKKAEGKGDLRVINSDILSVQLNELDLRTPLRLVGNLPYNISTPLMFHLLSQQEFITDMIFMVQKEVADRIVAGSGNKQYGRLSVMMQYYCKSELLFDVAPGSFKPPPKVDSSIIRLLPHTQPIFPDCDVQQLDRVVSQAFNQRRKTIANSLSALIGRAQLEQLGISPRLRAENLSLEDFVRISEHVSYA